MFIPPAPGGSSLTVILFPTTTFTLTALNDSEDGTWELTDDNDTLILDGEEMTIVKLTKDELVLEGEEVDDEYGIYSATLHLKW